MCGRLVYHHAVGSPSSEIRNWGVADLRWCSEDDRLYYLYIARVRFAIATCGCATPWRFDGTLVCARLRDSPFRKTFLVQIVLARAHCRALLPLGGCGDQIQRHECAFAATEPLL